MIIFLVSIANSLLSRTLTAIIFFSGRPTEISESDTFICNSLYDELNRQIRKLPVEGIKKYYHSNLVTEDEIYYFPKLINPTKVSCISALVKNNLMKRTQINTLQVQQFFILSVMLIFINLLNSYK